MYQYITELVLIYASISATSPVTDRDRHRGWAFPTALVAIAGMVFIVIRDTQVTVSLAKVLKSIKLS